MNAIWIRKRGLDWACCSGPFLSGLELVHVLNLGRSALLALQNLAGSFLRFRRERPRSASQGFQDRKHASTARTFPHLLLAEKMHHTLMLAPAENQ